MVAIERASRTLEELLHNKAWHRDEGRRQTGYRTPIDQLDGATEVLAPVPVAAQPCRLPVFLFFQRMAWDTGREFILESMRSHNGPAQFEPQMSLIGCRAQSLSCAYHFE